MQFIEGEKNEKIRKQPAGGITLLWLLAVLILICGVFGMQCAYTMAIVVNDVGDGANANDGKCTLREAISNANADDQSGSTDCTGGSGGDTITFNISGTITLGSTLPQIGGALTIDGMGESVAISGNNSVQVMSINFGATLKLDAVTIQNASHIVGGGIVNNLGTLTITNSTFSGNSADFGGGIYNNFDSTLNLLNTIIANSTSGGDCLNDGGTIVKNTNNLIEDGSCSPALTGDPKLVAPANNGGPTQTMALASDSPAIDKGDNATCAAAPANNLDQRGFVRPIDGDGDSIAVCDIGAFEFGSHLAQIEAPIDIKFCTNPNRFNCKRNGVLPVTIFGMEDLGVSEITLSTVQLCLASDAVIGR